VAVAAATTPATGRAPLAVSFSSAGSTDPDGTIVSYRWKWGDGTADGTTATPTHTFTAAGTYVVTLTVTDDDGATGTASTTVVVSPNQAPLAAASTPTPVVVAPATVPFSSEGSVDPDGTIVSYSWDFGDGGPTSTAANPTRSFTDPGSYTVTLTVVDDDGATDVASLHLQVLPANRAPVAVANATPAPGNLKAPLTVEFSSAGSTDPDGTIVSFAWDFGDGTTSTQANPTHGDPDRHRRPGGPRTADRHGDGRGDRELAQHRADSCRSGDSELRHGAALGPVRPHWQLRR
jgi:PKD repeat protein